MQFLKRTILPTETTLSPALETPSICALAHYFNLRFTGTGKMTVDDKPQAVVCFDTSGCGKKTTVREASGIVKANRVIISPNLSPVLAGVLSSCYNRHQFAIEDGFIKRESIEEIFEFKFNAAVVDIMGRIISLLQESESDTPLESSVDEGDYCSPNSSTTDIRQIEKNGASQFKQLRKVLGERNLVIHVDDCQLFFKGVIPSATHTDKLIPAGEEMSLALRCFSKCITPFTYNRNIVWVFSGTRPNLLTEITLTSGLDTFDISEEITDFKSEDILKILGNYYDLQSPLPQISQLSERLSGPPKLVYFFLKAASKFSLLSQQDLIDKWAHIEESAVALFKTKVDSTFKGNLDQVARNLCLLHSSAVTLNQDFIDINAVSRHLIDLIEAGLLRIHKRNQFWRIFAPNRFLIQIFSNYVRWYTWERLEILKSLIQSSSLTKTQNGKVFEYLFALELCNAPDCKLWKFLSKNINIQPIASWSPIIKQMENLGDCSDKHCIYVMVDPDRVTTKIDVVFFAIEIVTLKVVRVLVQLTISSCSLKKVTDSFNCMLDKVVPAIGLSDYRLFIGPKSSTLSSDEQNFYTQNYSDNRCFAFLQKSGISEFFELPIEQLCDPAAAKESVGILVQMAEKLGDKNLAYQLAGDFSSLSISKKRSRLDEQIASSSRPSFTTLAEFYNALESLGVSATGIATITAAFQSQEIIPSLLSDLTDTELERIGITQLGLRKAILKVLG